jgi:MFS transporter, DHA2 family, multidrug resistance protein
MSAATSEAWRPRNNRWLIAIVVTVAAFMELLDTTIVNVALAHIAGSMSSSPDEATWALTSYLIANGIVLPISGFLSRLFGRKAYFLVCVAAFTLFSFLCGIAGSLAQLVVFRMLQGFFGGGLQPSQQSIILDVFDPGERSRAFAVTAVATILAPIIGPTLGGWITSNYSWRWVFLINVPVGVVAFFGVSLLVEDPPWARRGGGGRVDHIGLGLIALGFGCLQFVLDRGENEDWFASPLIRIVAVLAVIGLVGAVYWLLYTKRPIVDLRVLADRNFAVGSVMMFVLGFILYSSAVLIALFAQRQLGYDAVSTGLVLFPGSVVVAIAVIIISRVMALVQARVIVAAALVVLGLAMAWSHRLTLDIDFATLAEFRAFQTVGLGLLYVPVSTLAYFTLPNEQNADAAALFTMVRNVSGSIGIAITTASVTSRTQVHQAYLAEHLSLFHQPFRELVGGISQVLIDRGLTPPESLHPALGRVGEMLAAQSAMLANLDVFALYAAMCFAAVPLVFLFSPVRASQTTPGIE